MSDRVLVTGSSGFVGRSLVKHLAATGSLGVRAASRKSMAGDRGVESVRSPDLTGNADWRSLLMDVQLVVHSAARVHVMSDQAEDPLAEFRAVNVEGTLALARQAAEAGVKRFIFISSIKVNGEQTKPGRPFYADDSPAPVDPYGISKLEAEEALKSLGEQTAMEVVIIRPVLVYGPGVGANFKRMLRWLERGVPLPLGAVDNRRSLVAMDNLVNLIEVCLLHPAAAGQTFLAGDGEDFSTSRLLQVLAEGMGRSARLLPIPIKWLKWIGKLSGRSAEINRLTGSLQVDLTKNRELLGWVPPVQAGQALRDCARSYCIDNREIT